MTKRAWMPLYIGDYLAATSHLDATESGAYLHLIMHYWEHGGLPDDTRSLQKISKTTPHLFRKILPTLQQFFHDGWRHKRIDEELRKVDEISVKRAFAGRKRHAAASASAQHMHTHARATPHTHTQREEGSIDSPAGAGATTKPARARPRIPLPEAWAPKAFDPSQAHELEKFRDHARANARLCADWDAAWRNWKRMAPQFNGGNRNGHQRNGSSVVEAATRLVEYFGGDEAADRYVPGSSGPRPIGMDIESGQSRLRLVPPG